MKKILEKIENESLNLCVTGLGYVGLPLAIELSKVFEVFGLDTDKKRIEELTKGFDRTGEISALQLQSGSSLTFTSTLNKLKNTDVYIITVPTPVDKSNKPDLSALISASEAIGTLLRPDNIVVYESTVYPGATEEICVPILEEASGLKFNKDFFVGYSPERINPGDKSHRITDIKKVTSGSTNEAAIAVDLIYQKIITAGTYKAENIKVAEAAKVIENTQRDINIAFINELSMLFDRMNIDTQEVLKAASTKWNFLQFSPGLVGGHCIGVDPYYLTHKAIELGHSPDLILAGRKVNDGMGEYVAAKLIKAMFEKNIEVKGSKVLVLGITFKENCPDIRNSKVFDVIKELTRYKCKIDVYDPHVNKDEITGKHFKLVEKLETNKYSAVIVAVAHKEFKDMDPNVLKATLLRNHIIYDLKSVFVKNFSDMRL